MNYQRFRPRDAVKILADRRCKKELKTWAIARLLSWISLDQRPRRVQKQSTQVCGRMRSRASNANLAGNVVLASLLYRGPDDRRSLQRLVIFLKSDGFRLFLKGPRSPKNWLHTLKNVKQDMMDVHAIMSYLCRYNKYGRDPQKLTIEAAKQFVIAKENKPKALSKISKTWEPHTQAAPYIFSFVSLFSDTIAHAQSIDELVDHLEKIAANQTMIDTLLGNAAYATSVLKGHARKVREADFTSVQLIEPCLEMFDSQELLIIQSIELTKSEGLEKDFTPKPLPVAEIARQRLSAMKAARSPASS
jgi:hypothetical protein